MFERPDQIHYYLGLAIAAAARAECTGNKVGAVLVRGERVISTGYNGTPKGWPNCNIIERACPRCLDPGPYGGRGNGYDKCICVHAEMNAIASAARFGMATNEATAFVTHQPCITCAKELIQAGVEAVFYMLRLPMRAENLESRRQVETVELLNELHAGLMERLNAQHVHSDEVVQHLGNAGERFANDVRDAMERHETDVANYERLVQPGPNGAT